MARKHINSTNHSLKRMAERSKFKQEDFVNEIKSASKFGKSPYDYNNESLRKYLFRKGKDKRIKVYKNYIWIFNKHSDALITMYPLPREYRTYDKEKK